MESYYYFSCTSVQLVEYFERQQTRVMVTLQAHFHSLTRETRLQSVLAIL